MLLYSKFEDTLLNHSEGIYSQWDSLATDELTQFQRSVQKPKIETKEEVLELFATPQIKAEAKSPNFRYTIVEAEGSISLVQTNRGKYLVKEGALQPIAVKYKGRGVSDDTLLDYKPIAADQFSGSNQILLSNEEDKTAQVWFMDNQWRWMFSSTEVSWDSQEAKNLEVTFQTDINKDGIIGGTQRPPTINKLGTNLSGIVDWSTAFPFVDAFKSSRPFTLSNLDGTDGWYLAPTDVDANGWVKSIPTGKQVNTVMYTANIPGYSYPWREFIVLYEGEGTISYSSNAVKNESASTLSRDVINVNPQNGIFLSITATNPENYLRNIRVIPTEWEETYSTQLFNPNYLAKLEPFSAFRFMDQMATNNSTQKDWADRPTVQDASWQSKGSPVEIMVQFANETGSDPWFTMPHQATDDYVRSFATYVRDNLDPNLDVYIEYSNEVWNGGFQQYYWVLEQAKATWPTSTESDFTKVIDWYSLRTTQVTRIWDEVFGADKGRVIGVMAGMAASSWVLDRALDYAWTTSPLSNQQYGIDVLSIAPYFGYQMGSLENETTLNNWTQERDGGLNKLFQELETGGLLPVSPTGGALNEVNSWISSHAALAEAEGLGLTAYEAGQHLAVHPAMYGNTAIVNLFSQANRDPRMGEIYDRYLQMWSDLGGGLMMNYTDIGVTSQYGSWGSLEHLYQDSSPKWDALTGFNTT